MQPIKVEIKDLSKVYPNGDGIKGIGLTIYTGEILTLLGPSGCGKSTILRALGGFNEVDSGQILIDGQDVTTIVPEKRPTSMVFQGYNLWTHMTVFENLALGLKLRKLPKNVIKEKIQEMLIMLNLPDMGKKYPSQLSGGQQQRIAIGRSLLLEPAVLLLDEPYSALDAKIRVQMREELKRIQKETKVTVVFVTHDQEEALSLSNRIVVMDKGEIAQIGTPSEIYDQPANRYTASFIGEMNFLMIEGTELAFRPENVSVFADSSGHYQGQIVTIMSVGHYVNMTILFNEQELKVYLSREIAKEFHEAQKISFDILTYKTYLEEENEK